MTKTGKSTSAKVTYAWDSGNLCLCEFGVDMCHCIISFSFISGLQKLGVCWNSVLKHKFGTVDTSMCRIFIFKVYTMYVS